MLELDIAQRKQLTADAHHLSPIVTIGKEGLTTNIISELDRSLTKHELIKVKIFDDDRTRRAALFEQICQTLNAAPIKLIGKIMILYRPEPDQKNEDAIASPAPRTRSKSNRTRKKFTAPKLAQKPGKRSTHRHPKA